MANSLALTDPCLYRLKRQQRMRKGSSSNGVHCEELTTGAAIDVVILVLVFAACGVLFMPYFKFLVGEAVEVVPAALVLVGEVVLQAPVAYASATVFTFVAVLASFEVYQYVNRKCENPNCLGLKKAMELDIQLETEECVREGRTAAVAGGTEVQWNNNGGVEQKELEAELRRMASANSRAVLIFRKPCGCPAARFEASGSRKARRSKK